MKIKNLFILPLLAGLMLVGCKNKEVKPSDPEIVEPSEPSEPSEPEPEPTAEVFSFTSMVSAYASAGIEGVVIPDYVASAGATCELVSESNYFAIKGSSAEEMTVYATSLAEAGWNLSTDEYGDFSGLFGETLAKVYLGDYSSVSGYECIVLQFGIAPSSNFPSAEIAEDLAALGCQDVIPALSNEELASAFSWYCESDGIQLAIIAAEGHTEAEVIAAYQADLLLASFTEAGADEYGDMHYTSEHSELDVCVWAGSDIGYTGYIFVDITIAE